MVVVSATYVFFVHVRFLFSLRVWCVVVFGSRFESPSTSASREKRVRIPRTILDVD